MSNNEFSWNSEGTRIPEIQPHSKAKHTILEDYVKNWIVTLCGNNMGKRKTVTLIDGFCGGGLYYDPEIQGYCEGSPFFMIRMVEEGLKIVRETKGKPDYQLNVKYIFIDKKRSHLDCLKLKMRERGLEHYVENPNVCSFICNEFETLAPQIISEVKQRGGSSLFFLDPFGYTQVSMSTIRNIIGLGKSEVIYTFMIDFIKRFMTEREGKLENAFTNILEANDYYKNANINYIDNQSHQEYLRNETLRLFRNKTNANYVYSFALLTNPTIVKYYLIHLSSNSTALKVMKCSLWQHNNIDLVYQFRYNLYGLGFSTPEYFERNQKIFDIKEGNANVSIESLNDEIMPIICNSQDGVEFDDIHNRTIQTNPATIDHYMAYIDEQRNVGEIQVWRNGKITRSKQLKPGDIVIKSRQRTLFDMSRYHKK